ncbi:hypothetical protein BRADI_1g05777v3 [Brachypodium distachyon]|uniref:Uncharacterized protein n=1 Tax=Brachypodium distachyon TaxID=15368 RepID=A0A0Q3J445_BRADI|nr:hypothetical protein BRADI_1g05777v3 [Brachypodium distachyon]
MLFKASIENPLFWSPTYFHWLRNSRRIRNSGQNLGKIEVEVNDQ